jgi:hypothetical protein
VRVSLENVAVDFFCFNPHTAIRFTSKGFSLKRTGTDPDWRKWAPTDPTSAHWYEAGSLKTLIAAEINKARRDGSPQRTVADLIAEFRGLSSTAKRHDICEAIDAARQTLDAFFARGDRAIERLLYEMKAQSRPVKAGDLGVIGETHLLSGIAGAPSSRRYKRIEVDVDGVPYLVECAFSFRPDDSHRIMVTGLNWSSSVSGNPFQCLGAYDEGLESLLAQQYADHNAPIGFVLHVASPRLMFLDKGKSDVDLPAEVDNAIVAVVRQVTAQWCKQRRAEERHASAAQRRIEGLREGERQRRVVG